MQVICLEEPAFYELIDKVVDYIKSRHNVKEDKWISGDEAMKLLKSAASANVHILQLFLNKAFPDL